MKTTELPESDIPNNVLAFPVQKAVLGSAKPTKKEFGKEGVEVDSKVRVASASVTDIEAYAADREFESTHIELGLTSRVKLKTLQKMNASMKEISDFEYLDRLVTHYETKDGNSGIFPKTDRAESHLWKKLPAHVMERIDALSREETDVLLERLRPKLNGEERSDASSFVLVQRAFLSLALIERRSRIVEGVGFSEFLDNHSGKKDAGNDSLAKTSRKPKRK